MERATQSLEQAVRLLQAGRLTDAESICNRIVTAESGFAEAWHLLGVIALQAGHSERAVAVLKRAVAIQPSDAEAQNNLGIALRNQHLLDEAIVCFRQAVKLKGDFAEATLNLGRALQEQGKFEEAIACYLQALIFAPSAVEFHQALGSAFHARGNLPEAITAYRCSLELNPTDAAVHFQMALALQSAGQTAEAISEYRKSVELKPDFAEAHFRLGTTLHGQWKIDEAIVSYQRAAELLPSSAEVINYLGAALKDIGMLDEALEAFKRSIQLKPEYAEAHHNIGIVYKDTGRVDEAILAFRRSLVINPSDSRVHSSLLFTLLFHWESTPSSLHEEHRRWHEQHAQSLTGSIPPHTNDRSPDRRLKVGYVSPDFRDHCQALFTVPLFSWHDHENFEYFCYSSVAAPDHISERLRSNTDVWTDVAQQSDERLAKTIRDDRIDVLVDLTMHMAGNRLSLFARKPAPVQVSWLAYPGTTGLSTIDYRLTDPYLDPPGLDDCFYSERSLRLPGTFWCYDPLASEPSENSLPALSNGFVTFGSPHNFCKVNDAVIRLWARVLHAVDKSRLIVLAPQGAHRQRTLDHLARECVAPARITFFTPRLRPQYLELFHQIDIVLDTFPYNGHTTSLDAYWMGVPVVTLVGQTVVGRAGLSQLTNLGLTELIADTPERFVAAAVGLAHDLPQLTELRGTLRQRLKASPLMDAPRFARNMESAYRQMWKAWCAKEPQAVR